MDYSIHDAIEAGFNKIVFIIRKDIKDAFKEAIGDRIEKICNNLNVEIAFGVIYMIAGIGCKKLLVFNCRKPLVLLYRLQ